MVIVTKIDKKTRSCNHIQITAPFVLSPHFPSLSNTDRTVVKKTSAVSSINLHFTLSPFCQVIIAKSSNTIKVNKRARELASRRYCHY